MERTFKVAGVTFENRQIPLANAAQIGISQLILMRDKYNPYDSNAIKVIACIGPKAEHIGFVPRTLAAEIAPLMDAGTYVNITGWQLYGGGTYPIGLSVNIRYFVKHGNQRQYTNNWAYVNRY